MVATEDTDLRRRASLLPNAVDDSVFRWSSLPRRTLGIPPIDSLDGVGAHLVEGDGRGPGLDSLSEA